MSKARAYERIERELRARVADGSLAVGTRLAAERDLAVRFGVSRPTVREALRVLVREGVLNVRRGAGVTVIARPAPGPRADQSDGRLFELLEARIVIEGEIAHLAASRMSEGQLVELDALVKQLERAGLEPGLALEAERKFHFLVAAATMNNALVSAVRTLWEARVGFPSGDVGSAGIEGVAEHRAIVAALRKKEPEAAKQAMRAHLERTGRSLIAAVEEREVARARQKVASSFGRYVRPLPDGEPDASETTGAQARAEGRP